MYEFKHESQKGTLEMRAQKPRFHVLRLAFCVTKVVPVENEVAVKVHIVLIIAAHILHAVGVYVGNGQNAEYLIFTVVTQKIILQAPSRW